MNTASFISCTFRKSPESTTYKTDLIYDTPNPSRGLVVSFAYSELSIFLFCHYNSVTLQFIFNMVAE